MGYNIDKMIEQAKKGEMEKLIGSMSKEDAVKIKGLLNDKEACKKLLNSAQAQQIIEMLKRGGNLSG